MIRLSQWPWTPHGKPFWLFVPRLERDFSVSLIVRIFLLTPATFNLDHARQIVQQKYGLDSSTPVALSYQASDGMSIDLEDKEDIRAFQVYASREPVVTLHADFDQAKIGSAGKAQEATISSTPSKSRGRRGGRSKSANNAANDAAGAPPNVAASESAPRQDVAETSMAEVSANLHEMSQDAPQPPSGKHKSPKRAEPVPEPVPEAAPEPAPEAGSAESTQRPDDDDDEDVPLSQQSVSNASTGTPSPEKPRRHRRTKAEMEAFRAEQAAKKLEKEQSSQAHKSSSQSEEADAADTTTASVGDETTIVHDNHNDEPARTASASIQALEASGPAAMQQRLSELKAKKQRKNAAEREEQKLLMDRIKEKGLPATAAEPAETSSREYHDFVANHD